MNFEGHGGFSSESRRDIQKSHKVIERLSESLQDILGCNRGLDVQNPTVFVNGGVELMTLFPKVVDTTPGSTGDSGSRSGTTAKYQLIGSSPSRFVVTSRGDSRSEVPGCIWDQNVDLGVRGVKVFNSSRRETTGGILNGLLAD